MSPSTFEPGDGNDAEARARSARSSRGDHPQPHAAWQLEEIDAPETWTLASFDDLVPRELF